MFIRKKITSDKPGDILEVRIRDQYHNTLYVNAVSLANKKEFIKLLSELQQKGASFPSSIKWFD